MGTPFRATQQPRASLVRGRMIMRVHGPMTPKPGLELDVFFLIGDGQYSIRAQISCPEYASKWKYGASHQSWRKVHSQLR
jgi:hypothetical protein